MRKLVRCEWEAVVKELAAMRRAQGSVWAAALRRAWDLCELGSVRPGICFQGSIDLESVRSGLLAPR